MVPTLVRVGTLSHDKIHAVSSMLDAVHMTSTVGDDEFSCTAL
jgi:hypothetical protein